MSNRTINSQFGLIGDDLELKREISVEIDQLGKIKRVSFEEINDKFTLDDKIDNSILIPGFINSHTHIADSFAKEQGFNWRLREVVAPPGGLKHRILRMTPNTVKIQGIKKASEEMMSNGITSFIDFREEGIEGIELLRGSLAENPIQYLILGRTENEKDLEEVYERSDGIGLSSYNSFNENLLKTLKTLKSRNKKPIACHCAEIERDDDLLEKIIQDDIIDVIVHGTHFIGEDLKKIIDKKIGLILCPRSNGYFGVGFPPVNEILELNMNISLGTDNLMSNSADLFEEMRYLYRIARVMSKKNNQSLFSAKDLLKMVTINAARIFKLDDLKGSIAEGKDADLVLIDLNQPNFYSKLKQENLLPLLLNRTKSENIKRVYIKGEIVHERP